MTRLIEAGLIARGTADPGRSAGLLALTDGGRTLLSEAYPEIETRPDEPKRPPTELALVSGLQVGAPGRIRTCAFASGGRRSIP